MKKIGIVMAMQAEAKPVIASLGLKRRHSGLNPESRLPFQIYLGEIDKKDVCLVVNGQCKQHQIDLIGSQPAVLSANHLAQYFKPDIIMSAGTAGGLKKHGAEIGDVYLSDGPICFHDRRIQIDGFRDYGVGRYPSY